MDASAIVTQLRQGSLVRLTAAQWEQVADGFEVVEQHDTGMRGLIVVVRRDDSWAVVEEPSAQQRVVRPLPDREAVQAFVAKRLEQYDRMWDGCGCRIDYDE